MTMRERITLVHPPTTGIDPETITLDASGLRAPAVEAVREDRLTVPLGDLPAEIAELLRNFRQMRVRWASPQPYMTLDPFSSRLSPGLHVSYIPTKDAVIDPSTLCPLLRAFGPIDCMSEEAFTVVEAPAAQEMLYFYQPLENIHRFIETLSRNNCHADEACQTRIRGLDTAVSLDLTFDSDTNVSKFTALWPLGNQVVDFSASSSRRVEVGILSEGSPPDKGENDVGMSGTLVVMGETKTPSPTLFKFPSRHHVSETRFSSRFLSPTGMHPTLQIRLSDSQPPVQDGDCRPYTYLTLPKGIFADRYQFEDELFLASKNLTTTRHVTPAVDLEAPAYTTESWGSSVLLEMAPPQSDQSQAWTAEIPLHLRYLEPSETGERDLEVPYPVVFWACEAYDAPKLSNNPFDRTDLGYDELFGPETVFWHAEPRAMVKGGSIVHHVSVPVLTTGADSWIGVGTASVVALGFTWVLWKLINAYTQHGYGSPAAKGAEKASREGKVAAATE